MSTNENSEAASGSRTQLNNEWYRNLASYGSSKQFTQRSNRQKLHDCSDECQIEVDQFSCGTPQQTCSICSFASDGDDVDFGRNLRGTCSTLNTNAHANTSRRSSETLSRISILPQGNNDEEANIIKKKSYQHDLLKQMQIDKLRRYKEKDFENQLQKKIESEYELCYPYGKVGGGAPLRDVYGNNIMMRRNKDLIQMGEHQSKVSQPNLRNQEVPFKELFSNIAVGNPQDALLKKLRDCCSHLRYHSSSNYPKVNASDTTFARGGHGIFGKPLTDNEKRSKMKYQEELLEQIKLKQMKLQAEREKEKLEEERLQKQIEEQEKKFKHEENETNRKQLEEDKFKKLEKQRSMVLKYQQDLMEQIRLKKEIQERERRLKLEEELEMLKKEEEEFRKRQERAEEKRENIKFREPMKMQTRKPIIDVMKYQEELQKQMNVKHQMEKIEKLKSLMEDKEMAEQAIEREEMSHHQRRIKPKQRNLEDKKGRLNDVKLQEELLEQMRLKQQQALEEKLMDLAVDEELRRYLEEKQRKNNEFNARKKKTQFPKECFDSVHFKPDPEYFTESAVGGEAFKNTDGNLVGKSKIFEATTTKSEKEKINNLKCRSELLEQMREKEDQESIRKEEDKMVDLRLLEEEGWKDGRYNGQVIEEQEDGVEEYDKIKRLQILDRILDQIEMKRQKMRACKENEFRHQENDSRQMERWKMMEEREMEKRKKKRLKLPSLQSPARDETSKEVLERRNSLVTGQEQNVPVRPTRRHRTSSNIKTRVLHPCTPTEQDDRENRSPFQNEIERFHHGNDMRYLELLLGGRESNTILSTKSSGFLPKMTQAPVKPSILKQSNSVNFVKSPVECLESEIQEGLLPVDQEELWDLLSTERTRRLSKMGEDL